MLNKEEQTRYSRQTILPEIGIVGQDKLKSAKVLVIGAGGLGCPILQYLAAAGIGNIGIVDNDVVDLSNLHRQILYSISELGRAKATVAREKLLILNPHIEVRAYVERLTELNAASIISDYELIIDGSDNFETRYLVNDTCILLNQTLVFGSIFKFEGHVSVFNHFGGPNYRDIFPESPKSEDVPNCADIGVIGVVAGMIGLQMANEAIKLICNIGQTLSGILMTVNVLQNTTTFFNIPKSKPQSKSINTSFNSIEEIDQTTLMQWTVKNDHNKIIIDVRENYEFEESNIGGINIPLYELEEQIGSLPKHKSIVVICQTGQRSKIAAQLLQAKYKGKIYNLKHGIA
jgi:molybdopterin/thiamine biosynthesis adenylyltransferase/rhodanese-related sulfurtransferase